MEWQKIMPQNSTGENLVGTQSHSKIFNQEIQHFCVWFIKLPWMASSKRGTFLPPLLYQLTKAKESMVSDLFRHSLHIEIASASN
jgi:hypothetical protein